MFLSDLLSPTFFNFSLQVRSSSSFPEAGPTNNLSLGRGCALFLEIPIAIGSSGAAAITGGNPDGGGYPSAGWMDSCYVDP